MAFKPCSSSGSRQRRASPRRWVSGKSPARTRGRYCGERGGGRGRGGERRCMEASFVYLKVKDLGEEESREGGREGGRESIISMKASSEQDLCRDFSILLHRNMHRSHAPNPNPNPNPNLSVQRRGAEDNQHVFFVEQHGHLPSPRHRHHRPRYTSTVTPKEAVRLW